MEDAPRTIVRRGRMTGTFSRRFYKLAANNVCKLLARTRQARELETRLASIENFMDDPSVKEVARDIRVLVQTVALDREVLQRDLSRKPTLAQFAKDVDDGLPDTIFRPVVNVLAEAQKMSKLNEPLTRAEKEMYHIPVAMGPAGPTRKLSSLLWNALIGKNRHGEYFLPEDSPLFSIPPHIKCFREPIESRAHLLRLSYNEFKAGAHLCYNDVVFTVVLYAILLSLKFDRELCV
jgi:hypothetical protein